MARRERAFETGCLARTAACRRKRRIRGLYHEDQWCHISIGSALKGTSRAAVALVAPSLEVGAASMPFLGSLLALALASRASQPFVTASCADQGPPGWPPAPAIELCSGGQRAAQEGRSRRQSQ